MSFYPYLYGAHAAMAEHALFLLEMGRNEDAMEQLKKMKALCKFFEEKNPKSEQCTDTHHQFNEYWNSKKMEKESFGS